MLHNIPVIRLEIEGMKQSIAHALSDYALQLDGDIQAAVDAFCEPSHITALVAQTANQILAAVIREEVERFFRHGEGRHAVRAAVEEKLKEGLTSTVLDTP